MLKIFSSTTSRQPARLMIPAKQNAQNTKRVVLIIPFIPPRFNNFVISAVAVAGSNPSLTIMDTSNPLTVAERTFFSETPWKITPSIPATIVDNNITGIVGFCNREPANTIITGRSSKMFQLNIVSSCASIAVTVSEFTPADTFAFIPAIAYMIRETIVAGTVV